MADETSQPVHSTLPNGLGTYGALTGVIGAVVAFIVAWADNGLTGETVTLGATAGGILAIWYAGRSVQAKAAIEKGKQVVATVTETYEKGTTPPEGSGDQAPPT